MNLKLIHSVFVSAVLAGTVSIAQEPEKKNTLPGFAPGTVGGGGGETREPIADAVVARVLEKIERTFPDLPASEINRVRQATYGLSEDSLEIEVNGIKVPREAKNWPDRNVVLFDAKRFNSLVGLGAISGNVSALEFIVTHEVLGLLRIQDRKYENTMKVLDIRSGFALADKTEESVTIMRVSVKNSCDITADQYLDGDSIPSCLENGNSEIKEVVQSPFVQDIRAPLIRGCNSGTTTLFKIKCLEIGYRHLGKYYPELRNRMRDIHSLEVQIQRRDNKRILKSVEYYKLDQLAVSGDIGSCTKSDVIVRSEKYEKDGKTIAKTSLGKAPCAHSVLAKAMVKYLSESLSVDVPKVFELKDNAQSWAGTTIY